MTEKVVHYVGPRGREHEGLCGRKRIDETVTWARKDVTCPACGDRFDTDLLRLRPEWRGERGKRGQ